MTEGQFRIRDLELVVALHEEGNMTQAAKRLGISEPALSKQLRQIERRIQTSLFERGNLGFYVRVQLGGIATRVGASVHSSADIGKEQFVVSGALGAIATASGGGDKLRVAFVERRLFQEQKDVMLNPLLQVPNREQDSLGFASGSVPLLPEAIGHCLFLLRGL